MDVASSLVFDEEEASEDFAVDGPPYAASQQDDATSSSDLDGAEDEADTRPRFQGSDKAYRDYIAKERRLLASLLSQDSADLSVHLYNTHALKQRLYGPSSDLREGHFKNKLSWVEADEEGATPWLPPSDWTAWPLPPQHPSLRQTGGDRSDSDVFTDLLSGVQALILHSAKEKFDQRHWISSSAPATSSERSPSRSVEAQDDLLNDSPSTLTGHTPAPSFLVDEDEAIALTQPTAQHIMAKVDILLDTLHTSRCGHRLERSHRARDLSRSRSRSKTPGIIDHPANPSRRPHSPKSGLRDWSDVLGIAALAGWDTEVINRALRRCSSLFGEDMTFRTMPETSLSVVGGGDEKVEYKAEPIQDTKDGQESSEEPSQDAEGATDEVLQDENGHRFCPFPDCARSIVAYEKLWRWREHLKRTHVLSTDQIAATEARYNLSVSAVSTQEDVRPSEEADGFPCPYDECTRRREAFAVRWRLTEHLKRTHWHSLEEARRLMADGDEQTHITRVSAVAETEDQEERAFDRTQAEDAKQQTKSRKRKLHGS